MAKDSYWFRHDTTAGRGLKMLRMSHIHGHWGKGIYWDVCEVLRVQENYQFESDDSALGLLADLIGCKDSVKFTSWFNDSVKIGLLEKRGKWFFSPALSENMKMWEKNKNNGLLGGRPKEEKPKHNPTHNPNGTMNKRIEHNRTEQERENNESKYSRAHIFEKMEKHIRKNVKKYYPSQLAKAQDNLIKMQEEKGWSQKIIESDSAVAQEFDKADQFIFEKFIGKKMRKEMEECYDYYAARNFKIDGEPIIAWPSVMAGWMSRRDTFKKAT